MITQARPYALAAFEYAVLKKALPAWEGFLLSAAAVASDPMVTEWLSSPAYSNHAHGKLFEEVLMSLLTNEMRNFIKLLAEKKRLSLLPEIADVFKAYREHYEKTVDVSVTSAIPLDETIKAQLMSALSKRLQKKVMLNLDVDKTMIGGMIIRTNEFTLDGSVQGQLKRLLDSFSG